MLVFQSTELRAPPKFPPRIAPRNIQISVDRARNLYQRLLSRAVADLRTLQTIDAYQNSVKAVPECKLADYPKLDKALGITNLQSTERIWRSRGYFSQNEADQDDANPEPDPTKLRKPVVSRS